MNKEEMEKMIECEEDGSRVGLRALQLRDEPIASRINSLIEIMTHGPLPYSHQARLLLVSWNNEAAISDAFRMVESLPEGGCDISPHRLHQGDEFVDELCHAFYLGSDVGLERSVLLSFFKAVLQVATSSITLDMFRNVSLKLDVAELLPWFREAYARLVKEKQYLKASLILSLLARYDTNISFSAFQEFLAIDLLPPNAKFEAVGALQYLKDGPSMDLLGELVSDSDVVIGRRAAQSIEFRCS